ALLRHLNGTEHTARERGHHSIQITAAILHENTEEQTSALPTPLGRNSRMTSEPHTAPSAPAPQGWSRLYLAIAALFIACLLVANIITVKLVMLASVLCDERRRAVEMVGGSRSNGIRVTSLL